MAVIFYSNLIDFFSPKYSQNTLPIHYNDSKEKNSNRPTPHQQFIAIPNVQPPIGRINVNNPPSDCV